MVRTGTVATVMAGWMILTPAVYAEGSLKDAPTAKWHPWFEIGGYYNSLLSACRIVELFAGGRC